MSQVLDSFGTRDTLTVEGREYTFASLPRLAERGFDGLDRMPYSLRVLLENLLHSEDGRRVTREDIEAVAAWRAGGDARQEIAFTPARVLLQDFTGVPAVVDLAAMRDAVVRLGGRADQINPLQPVDLVIDHSVQVDYYGTRRAFSLNAAREYERNRERYTFLRWGQSAFRNFRVVPPETGIVHQINLEYLAQVAFVSERAGELFVQPDTLVGTDSHTVMINGLGVLGWGVGGIEAEAAMLGQPLSMLLPEVVGFRLTGELPAGSTATDLVLTVVHRLRQVGVVGKFVEFFGPGLATLSLADRATIANMGPEYGATVGYFPVDRRTIEYLRFTGRNKHQVALVEAYYRAQGLFHDEEQPEPTFSSVVELDLGTVEPVLAGPKRPQDKIALSELADSFSRTLAERRDESRCVEVEVEGERFDVSDGDVVIAAITSCTNTSNPAVMIAAGLVAKAAVERGLQPPPWVKTSLAPGSKVVTRYLQQAGLLPYLEQIGFNVVGYGCTTCIGNSGPLKTPIEEAIRDRDLVVASVLSGNRNFEGRISPLVRANYLASPPMVVAYALAGTVRKNLKTEPLGEDRQGRPVMLADLWPSPGDVAATIAASISSDQFREEYANVFEGDENWHSLPDIEGELFPWDPASTYIQEPPFFQGMTQEVPPVEDIEGARVLAKLGDSITTDHISPAGAIPVDGPAGRYLIERGVAPRDFNSFGSRRGNHEVMIRGTFSNVRLRNQLVPGVEGGFTRHIPSGEQMTIYDAAQRYADDEVPLIVLAGREYGSGSSRDWAAKGTLLLGVRAVIAESFERIHRSNLVGMGVLPLEFCPGENATSLGLDGTEEYSIRGLRAGLAPRQRLTVHVRHDDGTERHFEVVSRIDTPDEVEYVRHGGILQYVLRSLVSKEQGVPTA